MLSPQDLEMPPKFRTWRPYQAHAIESAYDAQARHCGMALPTGSGKSLIYMALSRLVGRAVVLTSTKTLQDQLMRDFGSMGLVDVRGRANYHCLLDSEMTCDDGSDIGCHHRFSPQHVAPSCPYALALKRAQNSRLVVTNYSYWVLQNEYGEGLGSFDLLVLDEAHAAMDELCNALRIEITALEVYRLLRTRLPAPEDSVSAWRSFARVFLPISEAKVEELKQEIASGGEEDVREYRRWKRLKGKLSRLASVEQPGQWVVEPGSQRHAIVPLWPAPFTKDHLFMDIPHVVLVSATLTKKTMALLGIPPKDSLFSSYPSVFKPSRYPLIHVPTVRVNYRWSPDDEAQWIAQIDRIIAGRRDRKGILHSVSYERASRIAELSQWSGLMLLHDAKGAATAVQEFKASVDPLALVSPSVSTGHDFPGRECEYQVLVKVPWPDCRTPLMAARVEEDPSYRSHIMCQALVQSCGRGMRAEDDRCENFVVDDYIRLVLGSCRDLLPGWFRRLYRRVEEIPAAPERLPEDLAG